MPDVTKILENVWRLRMPLKDHAVGHVNVYALGSDEDGLLLVDTAWGTEATRRALKSLLGRIGWDLSHVTRVLVSHLHADHCGLAGWLQNSYGAHVLMHAADARRLKDRYITQSSYIAATHRWLAAVGAPDAWTEPAVRRALGMGRMFVNCVPDDFLVDGQVIRHGDFELVSLHTPGHTPGSTCFFESSTQTLFSGDTILTRINYGPTLRALSSPDPAGDYTQSLAKLHKLEAARVLPGHQEPFPALRGRIRELHKYHRHRQNVLRTILNRGDQTVWDAARQIPRSRYWGKLSVEGQMSAVGEAYAHIVQMSGRGEVTMIGSAANRWKAL